MKKVIVAVPHSHTWFWTQTCLSSLLRFPPRAEGCECEIVVIDNSPWSPSIRGITDNKFFQEVRVFGNTKHNKFHASALDFVVETMEFDYLMAWETDVLAFREEWLQWFMNLMGPQDFAVGHWHHEQFVNPSCTLYRGDVLRKMLGWCKSRPKEEAEKLRWGEKFSKEAPLDNNMPAWAEEEKLNMIKWVSGPFADKRGWPEGTQLRETPSGQLKGPGWYEPGQMLHHWAVEEGHKYHVCQTGTVFKQEGMPISTFYGYREYFNPSQQLEFATMKDIAQTVHLWGGTRALDIIKHDVSCDFVKANTPFWLEREARFWRDSVPSDVQVRTLNMIRKYGWHLKGCGTPDITDRDREAVKMVERYYWNGGVDI